MNTHYRSIKKVRQQAIYQGLNEHIPDRKPKIHHNDPFEIYHYSDVRSDQQILKAIEKDVMNRVDQEVNIAQMNNIYEHLQQNKYMLEEQIKAEQIEIESLDILIRRLENQQKNQQQLKKTIKNEEIVKKNQYQQTESVNKKQIGVFTAAQIVKQKRTMRTSQAYSIKIKQNEQRNDKETLIDNTINIRQQQSKQNNIKTIKFQHQDQTQAQNIYQNLQKEIAYLQHLKNSSKNNSEYRHQKKRVKFMMELFWKTTLPNPPSDSDLIQLKELQQKCQ